MNNRTLEWSLGAALAAVGLYNCFSSAPQDLRAIVRDPSRLGELADIRGDYLRAGGLALLAGAGFSLLAKSPAPVVAAGLSSLAMVSVYESCLPANLRLLGPGGLCLGTPGVIDAEYRRLD